MRKISDENISIGNKRFVYLLWPWCTDLSTDITNICTIGRSLIITADNMDRV